ncbi:MULTISPECIES: hypothetical protein [Photorhabdus]|uniref:Uncharacterized protein n=1 Tax=Photorhabdus tasmaniensis TaxID=1004159 RepID=A0ABX0GK63_9GAMM|nr:hypothetical protein [Photorhabdus tasmaniensis]NHB89598.1 hypothetical protein [Photorhabdus tasmaniensis]
MKLNVPDKNQKPVCTDDIDRLVLPLNKIVIDIALFKQLVKFALNAPDLCCHLATVDINPTTAATNEITMTLEPSDFLFRLDAALRTCG